MTILKTHNHEGTVGASSTTGGEGYTTTSGAGSNPLYVANGIIGRTCLQWTSGLAFSYEDNSIASSYSGGWFRLPTLPTADCTIGYALNTSATVGAWGVNSTGNVILYSVLGTVVDTSTTTLTANTWYRFEWFSDGSAASPQQTLRLFTAYATTAFESLTGATNGVLQPNKWRFGHPQGTKNSGIVDLDKIVLADAWPALGGTPPTAAFTHSEGGLGTLVTGSGSGGSGTYTYDWDWGDGTTHGTSVSMSHTYAAGGTYTISLLVTDTVSGLTGVTTRSATVSTPVNSPPSASFTHIESGLTTSVNGSSSSDSDGSITAYDWNWGDASTHGTGSTASHTYAVAGTYTVTLTVTDNSSATGTTSTSVTVAGSGTPGTIARTHRHEGTIGATVSAAGEAYNTTSGAGGLPAYVAGGAVGASSIRWTSGQAEALEDNSITWGYAGFFIRLPTLPTGDNVVAYALTGTVSVGVIGFLSTGALRLYSGLGTTEATTTATLTANTWYKVLWHADAGAQEVRLYSLAGTLLETITGAAASAGTPDKLRIGHPQGAKSAGDTDVDKVVIGSGGWLDLADSPPIPVIQHTETNLTTAVDGTLSVDPDDSITGYNWDWGDSTAHGTTATASHTYAAAGTYTLTLTVTDATGFTGSTSTSVSVVAPVVFTGLPIRITLGGSDVVCSVRGVIVSGSELAASVREVVGAPPPGPGAPIPQTIPFTIGV